MNKAENKKGMKKTTSVGMITRINQIVTALLNGIWVAEHYSLYEYILMRTASIPDFWYLFPWNVITSIFLHTSVFHLLANMAVLAMVGYDVEEKYGSSNFMLIYLLCGVISGLFDPYGVISYGASGAIAGIVAIKLAMIADKEGFGNKLGFIAMNGLLCDALLAKLDKASNSSYMSHVYGSLVGIFVYYAQKNSYLDWLLDKGTINNATSSEIFRSDEITSGYGNHGEPEIEYPAGMQVEGSNDNKEMVDLHKGIDCAASA